MSITNVGTTRLTGSSYSVPSSAFSLFALESSSSGAIASQEIDSVEALTMLNTIYSFAQTRSATIPMLIGDTQPITDGMLAYIREGNADWAVKSKAAANTPHTTIDHDKRVVLETVLNQGHLIDMDMQRRSIIQYTPHVQAKLVYSLARNLDKLAQFAVTADVPEWVTDIGKSWAGARTVTTVEFDDDNRIVRTTNAATPAVAEIFDATAGNSTGTEFFDDLVNRLEENNIPISNVCCIGSPELRRQLKKIKDFRDAENNQSFKGNENLQVIEWLGIKFVFLFRDAYYNGKEDFEGKKYDRGGAIVSSGTSTTFGADLSAVKLETFVIGDFGSGMVKGGNASQLYARVGKRLDQSDADELYMKVPVAFGRKDESKFFQVIFKSKN